MRITTKNKKTQNANARRAATKSSQVFKEIEKALNNLLNFNENITSVSAQLVVCVCAASVCGLCVRVTCVCVCFLALLAAKISIEGCSLTTTTTLAAVGSMN